MDKIESISEKSTSDRDLCWDDHLRLHYRPAAQILAHPSFYQARVVYFQKLDQIYGDNPFLNKLMMQAGRMVLFFLTICLDAGFREDDRTTWASLANIKRILRPMALASDGHVSQLVHRLVQVGFLSVRPCPADARVRLLSPTPAMLAHDQDWLIAHYAPLATLYGGAAYELPMQRDPAFQLAQRGVAAAAFAQLAAPLLDNPVIAFFGRHDAAFMILTSLAGKAIVEGRSEAAVPYAELSRRYGVSRTHVRRLLGEAEAQGWVMLEGRAQRVVRLTPVLWEALNRFIAEGMSNHDRTARAALRLLADGANQAAHG